MPTCMHLSNLQHLNNVQDIKVSFQEDTLLTEKCSAFNKLGHSERPPLILTQQTLTGQKEISGMHFFRAC